MTATLEGDRVKLSSEQAWEALVQAPGVGVNVCTNDGRTLFANESDNEIYFGKDQSGPDTYEWSGRFPKAWSNERLDFVKTALSSGQPVRVRLVWRGSQILSLFQPVAGEDRCVIVSNRVAGPLGESMADVSRSRFVSLGVMSKLSPREVEVIALIGRGLPTRDIAELLDLSPKTVEKHRDAIVRKVGERSRIRLAEYAYDAGLQPEDAKLDRV